MDFGDSATLLRVHRSLLMHAKCSHALNLGRQFPISPSHSPGWSRSGGDESSNASRETSLSFTQKMVTALSESTLKSNDSHHARLARESFARTLGEDRRMTAQLRNLLSIQVEVERSLLLSNEINGVTLAAPTDFCVLEHFDATTLPQVIFEARHHHPHLQIISTPSNSYLGTTQSFFDSLNYNLASFFDCSQRFDRMILFKFSSFISSM